MADDADVIIVGAGLAGLVAAAELAEAGKKTIVVDQEPEQSLGGIFLVEFAHGTRRWKARFSAAASFPGRSAGRAASRAVG